LKRKHSFECFSNKYNVKIKYYPAENVPFAAREFKADIEKQEQEITFSGVGAHHQNGVAEKKIGMSPSGQEPCYVIRYCIGPK
jgi:hypothetical protein